MKRPKKEIDKQDLLTEFLFEQIRRRYDSRYIAKNTTDFMEAIDSLRYVGRREIILVES